MTWTATIFEQLSESDKLAFPVQMVENADLPIKAMSRKLYRRTLNCISHKGKLETLSSEIQKAHNER